MLKLSSFLTSFKDLFEKKRVVYISGPMSSKPDKNHPLFNSVTKEFRDQGYRVINPAENDGGSTDKTWEFYMVLDLVNILTKVTEVVVLPDWEISEGAQIEVFLAKRFHKPIYELDSVRKHGFSHQIDPITELKVFMQPKASKIGPVVENVPINITNSIPVLSDYSGTGGFVVDTGAKKFDNGKLRYSLLPQEPIHDLVRVLMFGAKKYGDFNWTQGFSWMRTYDALRRHLDGDGDKCKGWLQGEDNDPESGLPHLAHAMCNLLFLMVFAKTHPELDDRPFTHYTSLGKPRKCK